MDSQKVKSAILALITGIIFLVVIIQFFNLIASFIGALICGASAFFIGYNFFKEKIIEDIKSEVQEEVVIVNPSEKAISSLLELETCIALADEKLEDEIHKKVTSIIESLFFVIPEINKSFSSQTITFEVTKLGEKHFPNRIKKFLALNESDRVSTKNSLLLDLSNMDNVIKNVYTVLRNDSLNKNERESLLSDIKYGVL
jgi:hypothetical protein